MDKKRKLSDSEDDDEAKYGNRTKSANLNLEVGKQRKSLNQHALSDDSDTELNYTKQKKSKNDKESAEKYERMLSKMGWKAGQGLGKHNQGIVKPIDESDQKGRRGLGFKLENFDTKVKEWDYDDDPVNINELPQWLYNYDQRVPDLNTLTTWIEYGDKKMTLDDEDTFCSLDTLTQVLNCKSIFDNLENREMMNARTRSNPYETIGGSIFQNRAAMKMANIDTAFNFMFTDPKDSLGKSKIEDEEPLYFCDICSGPGGFSEYVLWRKKCLAKGFGMTLKGDCDFKLDEFLAGTPECFEPFYGLNGLDGNGDITMPENLKEFEKLVLASTNDRGVHFVMADGGFSVEGNENIQEILSKQLYLCQFLCALSVLREGGHFVCKLFDLFTPFSCGLVYLMHLCFERICIYKPVTSRPANSERYIICDSLKPSKKIIQDYMFEINCKLMETFRKTSNSLDIVSIVPLDILESNTQFFDYIRNSNEKLGKIQILNLKKIQAFATNQNLIDIRQTDVRTECLSLWRVPDENRLNIKLASGYVNSQNHNDRRLYQQRNHKHMKLVLNPDDVFRKINDELKNSKLKLDLKTMLSTSLRELTTARLNQDFNKSSVYDYRCMVSFGDLYLILGCGRSRVFEYSLENRSPNESIKWTSLMDFSIELPRGTLLLAEKVNEFRGEGFGQRASTAIHIIDVYFLNGLNMILHNDRIKSLIERRKNLKIFESIINKRSRSDLSSIRVKDIIRFEDINQVFDLLVQKESKRRSHLTKYAMHLPISKNSSDHYAFLKGIYIFKFVSSPWSVVFSKTKMTKYFFNYNTGESTYDSPNDDSFCANPKSYWDNGYIWKWNNETVNDDDHSADQTNHDPNKNYIKQNFVTKKTIFDFIASKV